MLTNLRSTFVSAVEYRLKSRDSNALNTFLLPFLLFLVITIFFLGYLVAFKNNDCGAKLVLIYLTISAVTYLFCVVLAFMVIPRFIYVSSFKTADRALILLLYLETVIFFPFRILLRSIMRTVIFVKKNIKCFFLHLGSKIHNYLDSLP